jgi:hypothetical protein
MSSHGLRARVLRLESQSCAPSASQIREAQHRARVGEPVGDLPIEAVEMAHRIRAAAIAAVVIASAQSEANQ